MVCRGSGELSTLGALLAGLSSEAGSWRAAIPADWGQGRTAYGGLIAALAVEAARRAIPGLAPLRAAQFAFVGPTGEEVVITPTLLRAGKSVTFVSVEVGGSNGIAAQATLCHGVTRDSSFSHAALPMPEVPPPADCPDLLRAGEGPVYLRHVEMRAAGRGRFMGGGARAEILAWARLRDPGQVDPTVALVALGDASPPAPLALLDRLVPLSTMTWSMELGAAPGAAGGWRLLELTGEWVREGYAAERINIWSEDGAPLLFSRQSVAIFA